MGFTLENGILTRRMDGETLRIELWGQNALRVRATRNAEFTGEPWALLEDVSGQNAAQADIAVLIFALPTAQQFTLATAA